MCLRYVAVVLAAYCFLTPMAAQSVGGSITGSIKDPQGNFVAGAAAKFLNVATGVSTMTLTNEIGIYRVANLQPGSYELTISVPGFAQGIRRGINLTVGAELTVDVMLNLASVADEVQVTAQSQGVETTTSSLSYAVTGTTIRELPLNGRDYTSLAILQPGVTPVGTSGGMRAGYGNKLSISGTRPSGNNFLFDGVSINDAGNNTPGSILGVTLGVDAVEQFTLITNTFSAEYGRATGGVLNAVTRSGTNQLHGSAFYFGRNSAMDARNFFDSPTLARPLFRRHQFGASAGGPIKKDRSFWFFDYEGVQQFLGTTTLSTVPSAALRAGTYLNPANNQTVAYQVDPQIARALRLYPLPNAGLIGNGNTGFYSAVVDQIADERYLLGKIDHRLSAKDSIRGSYFNDVGNSTAPDAFLNAINATRSRRSAANVEHTRIISPNVINVARFGVSRSVFTSGENVSVLNSAISDKSLGFVPGLDIGSISVAGLTNLAAGPTAVDYSYAAYTSYQIFENLLISRGAHALKFGFNFDRMQYNSSQPNLTGGQFSYGSLPGFITNGLQNTNPSVTFSAVLTGTNTARGIRQSMFAGFLQDDWRVRQNLTVNFGVRYEFTTIPTEVQGKVALLEKLTDAAPRVGGPVLNSNPTKRNFSPRIGFAYSPGGKTSIRAGFGLFDYLPLPYLFDTPLMRSFPFFTQGVLTNVSTPALYGSFPDKAYSLFTAGTLRTAYVDRDPARSYALQWNFNVQRQLGAWVATVGYVGSRGVHLVQVERNLNVVYPTLTEFGWWYPPASVSQKLNPYVSTINTTDTWNADSSYHAMHTSLTRQLARSLQVQGSYTWGKSIDNSSSTSSVTAGTGYPNAIGSPAPLIPGINRGLSDFDIRHNVVISAVWDLPGMKFGPKPLRFVSRGWELASIYTWRTGLPFTAVLNSDQAGTKADTTGGALGERPNLVRSPECSTLTTGDINSYIKTQCFTYPQPVTINGVRGQVLGNLGRNTLTAPGLTNLDFSFIKNDTIRERVKMQWRFELFNAPNHPNFSAPAFILYDSSGNLVSNVGKITSTTTAARQIQLGLKLTF